jgi:hypothetical protein
LFWFHVQVTNYKCLENLRLSSWIQINHCTLCAMAYF